MPLNIQVLEESFALVKPQAADFATSFYDILFGDYPAVQSLFAHVSMAEQREKLMSALVLMVDYLREPMILSDALQRLGARHIKYGVQPEHYVAFWDVLLKTLALALGDEWTEARQQAWAEAYDDLSRMMLAGAEMPPTPAVMGETLARYWLRDPHLPAAS